MGRGDLKLLGRPSYLYHIHTFDQNVIFSYICYEFWDKTVVIRRALWWEKVISLGQRHRPNVNTLLWPIYFYVHHLNILIFYVSVHVWQPNLKGWLSDTWRTCGWYKCSSVGSSSLSFCDKKSENSICPSKREGGLAHGQIL